MMQRHMLQLLHVLLLNAQGMLSAPILFGPLLNRPVNADTVRSAGGPVVV
jgi:hypothetical protein